MKKADWERMDDALHEISKIVGTMDTTPQQRVNQIVVLLLQLGYLLIGEKAASDYEGLGL